MQAVERQREIEREKVSLKLTMCNISVEYTTKKSIAEKKMFKLSLMEVSHSP